MRERKRSIVNQYLIGTLALVVSSCLEDSAVRQEDPSGEASHELTLETVASELVIPWALSFAPDGRIFVTERPGRIRVIEDGVLRAEPWARADVVPLEYRTEGGLLGIAVAPDFAATGHVYVVGTFLIDGRLVNRVLRYTERDGIGVSPIVVIDGLPELTAESGSEAAIHTHLGGALAFGPDGMLYLTTGDVTQPELAQDSSSLAGKLLRYRPDGTVPADNPIAGSPVYALGLRNSQGLAWHPETGDLIVTEHGPSELSWETNYGGWFGDELNGIVAGADYGWPSVVGMDPQSRFVDPLVEWSPSIAPASATVYSGPHFPWWGNVLVASLRGQQLRRIVLQREETSTTGWRVVDQESLLEGRVGRIRVVAMGPDGHLYIATSNRDGRGKPRPGDDRIYRVLPKDAAS